MKILVTGGAGYIGSHALIEFIKNGHTPTVVDNLSNSSEESIRRIEKIAGTKIDFHTIDVRDKEGLGDLFSRYNFDAIIHFAGLKAVGQSVSQPLRYYSNNIDATLVLLSIAQQYNVNKFIFSSSATVYGTPEELPLKETSRVGVGITNPYGQTKFMSEQIIRDFAAAYPEFQATLLRYFNPIGAHSSGMIGEDPLGVPNNLMPFIAQVAGGQREKLSIFGNDYPTEDGTCKRDYIHVVDLARGHLAALTSLKPGINVYNLGSGKPTSVLELVDTFIKTTGQDIPYEFSPRREGDLPEFYADPSKAKSGLGWQTELTIEDMCRDTWGWQLANPQGYR